MNAAKEPVRLAGRELGDTRHVCAFFNSKDEEYRVLLPFIKEGFEQGDRACHIVDPRGTAEHRRRLREADIDVAGAEESGRLEVRHWQDAYLRDDHFDKDRMLALIEEVLTTGRERGFPATRLVANMEWALEDREGVADLVEYESRLNYVLPHHRDPVCCTYDLSRFSASVVMDILRTHPMVIVGGTLQENPFYVPPDEFLEELKERKRHRATA